MKIECSVKPSIEIEYDYINDINNKNVQVFKCSSDHLLILNQTLIIKMS